MKKEYRNDFISMMVRGNWREDTEDRLTQIFSACFNISPLIRRSTFEYLNLPTSRKQWVNAYIKTQVANDITSRPDMKIYGGNNNLLAIIESKKDSGLSYSQLKRHEKTACEKCSFIVLTFAYYKVQKPWKACLWYELFLAIEKNTFAKIKKGEIDNLVCSAFLKYCKEKNYMRPTKLTCSMLCNASQLLSAVRSPKPILASNKMRGIKDLDEIKGFIELAYEKLRALLDLTNNKVGTRIESWSYVDDEEKSNNANLFGKYKNTVCLIGKKVRTTPKGRKKIGIYFQQGLSRSDDYYYPRLVVLYYGNKTPKEEASWTIAVNRKKKHFCEHQSIPGAQDKSVDFIEIERFCEIVTKIIKKYKHR